MRILTRRPADDCLFAYDMSKKLSRGLAFFSEVWQKTGATTNASDGALFQPPNSSTILHYGGSLDAGEGDNHPWAFDVSIQAFRALSTTVDLGTIESGVYTSSPDDVGYYLSDSSIGDGNDKTSLRTLTSINLDTMEVHQQSFSEPVPSVGGQLAYVPFGIRGALVALGGRDVSWSPSDLVSLSIVWIYDIDWWNQTSPSANTKFPLGRDRFCAVAVHDYGSASSQVVFYGGLNSEGDALNDIWALSLPDFTWFQYITGGGPTPSAHHLYKSTCAVVGSQYYALVGGYHVANDTTSCNGPRIAFYDLMKIQVPWGGYEPDGGPCQAPSSILDVLAERREPTNGWNRPELQRLFSNQSVAATPSAGTWTPHSSPSPSPSPSSASGGTIAGAVVGAVIGVMLVTALASGAACGPDPRRCPTTRTWTCRRRLNCMMRRRAHGLR